MIPCIYNKKISSNIIILIIVKMYAISRIALNNNYIFDRFSLFEMVLGNNFSASARSRQWNTMRLQCFMPSAGES